MLLLLVVVVQWRCSGAVAVRGHTCMCETSSMRKDYTSTCDTQFVGPLLHHLHTTPQPPQTPPYAVQPLPYLHTHTITQSSSFPYLSHLSACDDSLLTQLPQQACEGRCLVWVVKQQLNSSLYKLVVVVGQR